MERENDQSIYSDWLSLMKYQRNDCIRLSENYLSFYKGMIE